MSHQPQCFAALQARLATDNMCLTTPSDPSSTGAGTDMEEQLVPQDCNGQDSQLFELSSAKDDSLRIHPKLLGNSVCMEVQSNDSGERFLLRTCSEVTGQMFMMVQAAPPPSAGLGEASAATTQSLAARFIAGIVAGVAVLLMLTAGVVWVVVRRRRGLPVFRAAPSSRKVNPSISTQKLTAWAVVRHKLAGPSSATASNIPTLPSDTVHVGADVGRRQFYEPLFFRTPLCQFGPAVGSSNLVEAASKQSITSLQALDGRVSPTASTPLIPAPASDRTEASVPAPGQFLSSAPTPCLPVSTHASASQTHGLGAAVIYSPSISAHNL